MKRARVIEEDRFAAETSHIDYPDGLPTGVVEKIYAQGHAMGREQYKGRAEMAERLLRKVAKELRIECTCTACQIKAYFEEMSE